MTIVNDDGTHMDALGERNRTGTNWKLVPFLHSRVSQVRPLGEDFIHYLKSDIESTLSDDGEDEREDNDRWGEHFSFPELDERIRSVIREYEAMLPKPDFSSPKTIGTTVCNLWEECMRINWSFLQKGYVFDLLLTRDLSGGHVISFNAYAPHTDPLLLTYEEFHEVPCRAIQDVSAHRTLFLLELRHASVTIQQAANRGIDTGGRNKAEFGGISREGVTQAVWQNDP
ncbi:hypothetical protein EV401DRAFT_2197733 [Pisolithus croceorrhizus]|nr:hypothetical protein EV401DRAFT_2197733 [Pisolithus croceorrhizus]